MAERYPKLRDDCFRYFKDRRYHKGVETFKISSWEEFQIVITIFEGYKDYIWRGQKQEDWQLKSQIDRDYYVDRLVALFGKREDILKVLLEKSKEQLRSLEPPLCNVDSLEEYEIWTYAQHYGLLTHLLDWTKDPYIATYFALYEEVTNEQNNRVVYALNKAIKRLILKGKNAKKEIVSVKRFVDFLDSEKNQVHQLKNLRLEKQKGLFTKALEKIDIESTVWNYAEKRYSDIVENNKILLAKFLIPNKLYCEFLTNLEYKNIIHMELFPDYEGVVKVCKIDLDLYT